LIAPCILAGSPVDGIVLDPFMGARTTAVVAKKLGRNYAGCELNPEYNKIGDNRMRNEFGLFY
jgi:DNA modification methylase